ncbi:putative CAAX prenyl protease 2 [Lachnellula arida]|uniref:intramembrane prenyl-peptidase Rce1 n=1 Tax=Lachnellula arida TaxID=1316785 RepID=A0A8T9BH05_9HELO|nr:putative CAAX prenyl protease 2 [Lachnellula arida]
MAPINTSLYSRLKSYYTGEKAEPVKPPLTTYGAVALLVLYTLVYVLPFYISRTTRPSPQLSRDAPSVIKGRIASVTISCIICSLTTFVILYSVVNNGTPMQALHNLGWFPVGVEESVKAVALTATLFLGPLFEAGIVEGGWRKWIRLRSLNATISGWIGYRNYVAGPITEEILFRSASVPLLLLSNTSNTTIVFLTPIIFGLAHVHHFYEYRITHPQTPVVGALARSFFQLAYTSMFGSYATFLYLRTGSLLAVVLAHAFCNWMGLPRFWGRVTRGTDDIMGAELGGGKRSEDGVKNAADGSLGITWTIVYYILLVAGLYGWTKMLWTLTESPAALATF